MMLNDVLIPVKPERPSSLETVYLRGPREAGCVCMCVCVCVCDVCPHPLPVLHRGANISHTRAQCSTDVNFHLGIETLLWVVQLSISVNHLFEYTSQKQCIFKCLFVINKIQLKY